MGAPSERGCSLAIVYRRSRWCCCCNARPPIEERGCVVVAIQTATPINVVWRAPYFILMIFFAIYTTHTMSRSRNWTFTMNFEEDELQLKFDLDALRIRYYVYQHEYVTHHHLQGVMIFVNPRTFGGVKKLLGETAHIEIMKGTPQQAIAYCKKEESRVSGPYEFGTPPEQGKRNDLEDIVDLIVSGSISYEDCILRYPGVMSRYSRYIKSVFSLYLKQAARGQYRLGPSAKHVTVLHGPPGSGKTRTVFDTHDLDDIYSMTFGDGSKGSLWFDDYNGESVLLLDDFYGQIKFATLLRILDIYPLRVQCKGAYTYINFSTIYITSNVPPTEWYSAVDEKHKGALYRRLDTITDLTGDSITPSLLCTSVEDRIKENESVILALL